MTKKMTVCAAFVAAVLSTASAVSAADGAEITKAEITDTGLVYSYTVPQPEKSCLAVYDAAGSLKAAKVGVPSGTIEGDFEGCKVRLYSWNDAKESYDTVEATPTETGKLIFAMDFDNRDNPAQTGAAEINGSVTFADDGAGGFAAQFDGSKDSYITLKNEDGTNLLKGKDKLTVTFRKKADKAVSWWFFAAPDTIAQTFGQERYIGILDNGSTLTAERYDNSGVRTDSPSYTYSGDEWQDVTLVISKGKSTLYVDGAAADEEDYSFKISDMLGDSPEVYIGKACWGSGEWATGMIDDVEIYDFAPEPIVGDLSNVTSDITLPTADEAISGYGIKWSSSDEGLITSEGKVTPPSTGKREVTLTAEITFGTHTLTKSYTAIVKAADYCDYELEISSEKGVDIQQNMYGLFFEDINYSADGGLYAEMVENRSFEALKSDGQGSAEFDGMYGWSAYGDSASPTLKSEGGLNDNNTHYITVPAGGAVVNQAYDGMYMEAGKTYTVSAFVKTAENGAPASVKAAVYSDGSLIAEGTLTETSTGDWAKYDVQLTPSETVRGADFVISATSDADVDMVSCIPDDAVLGVFRKDLAEKLEALNPGFLRFPGGCIIEGYDLENAYSWKDSVGSQEERKQNWSRWSCHTSEGLDGGFKHYNQTYGLGFFEYFELCEYLDCDAVPVVNAGMACQYQSSETVPIFEDDGVTYTEEFYAYIQDALDLIEFANGSSDTTWGKVRCDMGHPEPFNLTMLGVGNEQWKTDTNQWFERYEAFEKEIHKVYPNIKLIGTSGPSASGTSFEDAWAWIRENDAQNDDFIYATDEHYYMSPSWFLANDNRYDNYDRGTKVFAGEYAAHTAVAPELTEKNNAESAIAEAAFMTGLERNADVVYMASYAPLFARIGYTQWAPDMIWFDDCTSYGSPTYYVQSMYMNNNGDYTLESEIRESTEKIYRTASYDNETGDIIIKIANPYPHKQRVKLTFDSTFSLTGKADTETLTSKSETDVNSISEPENIAPVKAQIDIADGDMYDIAPLSFAVVRVHTR